MSVLIVILAMTVASATTHIFHMHTHNVVEEAAEDIADLELGLAPGTIQIDKATDGCKQ